MALQSNTTAWWQRPDNGESLQKRIARINQINDPTTNADEILKYGKMLLWLLLAFTGLLGGLSYYKNFAGSFPHEAAIFMAGALTVVIEFGKNYCTKWALRIPFFRGFGHITDKAENTFVWVGLLAIAGATFYMSVYNSTIGGQQLSRMLHSERNQVTFAPDTRSIDAQIDATNRSMAENQAIKWKGTTTYTAQKAIARQSSAMETLQKQRADVVSMQRADFERSQAEKAENSNYAANLVMASGGWVELLQALILMLLVSCEKSLDKSHAPTPSTQKPGIGFNRPAMVTAQHYQPEQEQEHREPRQPIGFHRRQETLPVPITGLPTVPRKNTVEQCTTVEQPEQEQPTTQATVLADVKHWDKRAKQCFARYFEQKRDEKRRDNQQRCMCFLGMLGSVGVVCEVDWNTEHLKIEHPEQYTFQPWSLDTIQANKRELATIGKQAYA